MSERQYLLEHILYLSSKLREVPSASEKQNIENALLFYAKELHKLDSRPPETYIQ